jgi:1,4-dihydroxy-6-naphthoate synthase
MASISKTLRCACSPCPNDTFSFFHFAQNPHIQLDFYDISTLNRKAFLGEYDLIKVSFHAWLFLKEEYSLLQTGAALGRGCGPLLVARTPNSPPLQRVAVPGEYTTAHLLLRLSHPEIIDRVSMPFHQIMDAVLSEKVDAGTLIHEGRFVFQEKGLYALEDLGAWWEETTGHPIPLGCIIAKKSLGTQRIAQLEKQLQSSIRSAQKHPEPAIAYARQHAQELDKEVLKKHIKTYVNHFTLQLGEEGLAAIAELEKRAKTAGVIP